MIRRVQFMPIPRAEVSRKLSPYLLRYRTNRHVRRPPLPAVVSIATPTAARLSRSFSALSDWTPLNRRGKSSAVASPSSAKDRCQPFPRTKAGSKGTCRLTSPSAGPSGLIG
jgi:hypothetical protein